MYETHTHVKESTRKSTFNTLENRLHKCSICEKSVYQVIHTILHYVLQKITIKCDRKWEVVLNLTKKRNV